MDGLRLTIFSANFHFWVNYRIDSNIRWPLLYRQTTFFRMNILEKYFLETKFSVFLQIKNSYIIFILHIFLFKFLFWKYGKHWSNVPTMWRAPFTETAWDYKKYIQKWRSRPILSSFRRKKNAIDFTDASILYHKCDYTPTFLINTWKVQKVIQNLINK